MREHIVRVVVGSIAVAFAICVTSCSSDSSSSGSSTAASSGGVPCDSCKAVSEAKGAVNNVCTGAAEEALGPLITCMCEGPCQADCLSTTCQDQQAPPACLTCLQSMCSAQLTACQAN